VVSFVSEQESRALPLVKRKELERPQRRISELDTIFRRLHMEEYLLY
jgi:hypothetical protein